MNDNTNSNNTNSNNTNSNNTNSNNTNSNNITWNEHLRNFINNIDLNDTIVSLNNSQESDIFMVDMIVYKNKQIISDEVSSLNEYFKGYLNYMDYDGEDIIIESIMVYTTNIFYNMFIENIRKEVNYRNNLIKLDKLIEINKYLPAQRTPGWYDFRHSMLTASSLASAIGQGHFKTRNQLILSKCGLDDDISSFAKGIMEHGNKYEDVAVMIYENRNKVSIKEFGCLRHPILKCFGASPDGIVGALKPGAGKELFGRMLEIKVPPKRVIEPGVCPKHYWMQVQGQLEVCDLPDADFLQCKIEEFCIGSHYSCDNFYENGVIIHGYTSDKLEKGCVITYKNKCDPIGCIKYIYSELYQPNHKVIEWRDNECERILNDGGEVIDCKFWKLLIYDVTFVKRDKDFWNKVVPEIINFWSDVLKWRKKGIENLKLHIQYEKEKKKLDNEKMKKEKEDKLMVIKLEKETKRNKEKEEREKIKNEEEQMKAIEKGIKEKERKNKKEKKEKEKLDKKIKKDKERDIKKKTTTENKMTQDEKLKKIQANTIVLNI